MGWNENDVVAVNKTIEQLITRMIQLAEQSEETSQLNIAVDQILAPISHEDLSSKEKLLGSTSGPALRYYLMTNIQ